MPIFERGSSQCRAQHSWLTNSYVRARSCSLFSSFKKGKAFSLRCLSPLCSPAVGVGQTYPLRGDVVSTTGLLCRFNERRLMIPRSRRGAYAALAGWRFQCDLGIFATQKASVKSKSRWPFALHKFTSCIEASRLARGEYAHRRLRGSRAAIGSGGKKARPF